MARKENRRNYSTGYTGMRKATEKVKLENPLGKAIN
jgi:hypothetical protein